MIMIFDTIDGIIFQKFNLSYNDISELNYEKSYLMNFLRNDRKNEQNLRCN
jgi:hypothetical protein